MNEHIPLLPRFYFLPGITIRRLCFHVAFLVLSRHVAELTISEDQEMRLLEFLAEIWRFSWVNLSRSGSGYIRSFLLDTDSLLINQDPDPTSFNILILDTI